ncbi:hypothetical protein F5879DRAFT_353843 [Lentinula edodes]|uniref:uncharacterized protein n=1 Tax=Lentinula edodes TaxID=5353 RepID=UPI001E8E421F|nr:uncharacterized protein C8R40DRAFT_1066406 [Lentinula edodes]KAH7879305.1 hypothetical protein C8R40DRAFT_1066406 [Lentinula edodes]KAJ3873121.1 hypothetical protein F5051DRAFT_131842 [Lentinula edodes]KAJ3908319.1 hypothetical protein F5879DRAFT_353843 [Lentinula edodes]
MLYRLISALLFISSILSSHIVNGAPLSPLAANDSSVLQLSSSGINYEFIKVQILAPANERHKMSASALTVSATHASGSVVKIVHNIFRGGRITINFRIYIRVPILISVFIVLCLGVMAFVSEFEDDDEETEDSACSTTSDGEKKALIDPPLQ